MHNFPAAAICMVLLLSLFYLSSQALYLSSLNTQSRISKASSSEPSSPPNPESITVIELSLPPAINANIDLCDETFNPRGTGCINQTTSLQSGSFTADGKHVTAYVNFVGASSLTDIYSGDQIILIKTEGTLFDNGDPWKCLTCGVLPVIGDLSYPQAFKDGKRLLAGAKIIACGDYDLTDPRCLPEHVSIYPIRWNTEANNDGPGGSMRELRIHPDDTHLAWSSFTSGGAGQLGYMGRLNFNPNPTKGEPLIPRYDLTHVNVLYHPDNSSPLIASSTNELSINTSAIAIGEVRGFSGTGKELTYLGYPRESCNIDVFAVNILTGTVRRLTSHPEYVDPVDISPDDKWTVAMDTRGSGRQMFLAGMRHIPPIIDMLVTAVTASTRNNGQRRFFQPWLIDRFGDREAYFGQQINGHGDGSPGGINDPNWNGLADPKFSPDGTQIVYHQGLVVSPTCGEQNPLSCPESTAQGGRTKRIMLATLEDRIPLENRPEIVQAPDWIDWATPYMPGSPPPNAAGLPVEFGEYTLKGSVSGFANVSVGEEGTVAVRYTNFSHADSEGLVLNGYENVTVRLLTPTLNHVDWFSDLVQSRAVSSGIRLSAGSVSKQVALARDDIAEIDGTGLSRKMTSEDGFHITIDIMKNVFAANGTLTTIIDGMVWTQPENGT